MSFQAVSKWENAKCAPDIVFLPLLADIFNCSIDTLFSYYAEIPCDYDEITWKDDGVIRGVVFEGRKIKKISNELKDKFTFVIDGTAKNVESKCAIEVNGSVSGGCSANGSVHIEGHLSGGCNTFGSVHVGGCFSGGCCTTGSIEIGGNCSGDICCSELKVMGDIEAEKIKGNVVCNALRCDYISGDVSIKSSKE